MKFQIILLSTTATAHSNIVVLNNDAMECTVQPERDVTELLLLKSIKNYTPKK